MAYNFRNFCICLYIYLTLVATELVNGKAEALDESNRQESILKDSSECFDNCVSPGCIYTALDILKNMNPDVEPCDDFYKFVCGSFIEATIIPDDKESVTQHVPAEDIVMKKMRNVIERESSPNEPRPYKLAKDLYKSCMNTYTPKPINKISSLEPHLEPYWVCVTLVSDHLDLSVASMYFNEYVGKNVSKVINDITNEFKNILKKAAWMSEETRAKALEKVNSLKLYVMYPDKFMDIKYINEFYEKLELSSSHFSENMRNIRIFAANKSDENQWWQRNAAIIRANAFNVVQINSILFTAAFMEGIYFSNDRPANVNYAAIGFTIAHEILHGFDKLGRMYDKTGKEVDWWDDETKMNFDHKTQCLIDQYGSYTDSIYGDYLNGTTTLNENIADNVGLKVAYYAYKEWVKLNNETRELKLPGLPYTPEQIFWLSFANSWCAKLTGYELYGYIKKSIHSPPELRVNAALSNSEEFSQDFKCAIGSKMNPIQKCDIW